MSRVYARCMSHRNYECTISKHLVYFNYTTTRLFVLSVKCGDKCEHLTGNAPPTCKSHE